MFVHCSVIGRFTLSPGINTVPGAMLNIHIFFFPFFVYFRGCNLYILCMFLHLFVTCTCYQICLHVSCGISAEETAKEPCLGVLRRKLHRGKMRSFDMVNAWRLGQTIPPAFIQDFGASWLVQYFWPLFCWVWLWTCSGSIALIMAWAVSMKLINPFSKTSTPLPPILDPVNQHQNWFICNVI